MKFNRRGNILAENFIFIVLNLVFVTILLLFVTTQSGNSAELEEMYSKQMALVFDSIQSEATIYLNADKLVKKAEEEYVGKIFVIEGNNVIVKLTSDGGHSYSFFNDKFELSTQPYVSDKDEYKDKNYYVFNFVEKENLEEENE